MLGMYVHTHWGYNHPYSARTWTLADWQGYLEGLTGLGYDFLMIWPLLDSMPPAPTASDRAFLSLLGEVIDLAQQRYGLRVAVIVCPNTIGNEHAAHYTYRARPYFACERKVDPGDRAAVAAFLAGRRAQLQPLAGADALAIIDSDPGGYVGSTNDQFVDLMRGQIDVYREFHPSAELLYWMFIGWENYNRFWAQAQGWQPGRPTPRIGLDPAVFAETLDLMGERIPEPWGAFFCRPEHVPYLSRPDMAAKTMAFPYGLIEGEPTFPLTDYDPARIERGLSTELVARCQRGALANCQTHCLQLPHTYLYAHCAQGGTLATADLAGFAERLLPGAGELIAEGWRALVSEQPPVQRAAADRLEAHAGQAHRPGPLCGLLFGDADRFLVDLAMNLRVRADLLELGVAVERGRGIASAARAVLGTLRPYQQRTGYVDAYGGALYNRLNRVLENLDPAIDAVLDQFHNWSDPSVRHGILPRLLDALAGYAG